MLVDNIKCVFKKTLSIVGIIMLGLLCAVFLCDVCMFLVPVWVSTHSPTKCRLGEFVTLNRL